MNAHVKTDLVPVSEFRGLSATLADAAERRRRLGLVVQAKVAITTARQALPERPHNSATPAVTARKRPEIEYRTDLIEKAPWAHRIVVWVAKRYGSHLAGFWNATGSTR